CDSLLIPFFSSVYLVKSCELHLSNAQQHEKWGTSLTRIRINGRKSASISVGARAADVGRGGPLWSPASGSFGSPTPTDGLCWRMKEGVQCGMTLREVNLLIRLPRLVWEKGSLLS